MIFYSRLILDEFNLNKGASLLAPRELERVYSLKSLQRRKEILATHYLIQKLLEKSFDIILDKIEIKKKDSGKPYLDTNKCENIEISYAHSKECATLVCSYESRVGVDTELTSRFQKHNAYDKWLHEDELVSFKNNKLNIEDLCDIWCKKESLAKLTELGYSLTFKDICVHNKNSIFLDQKKYFFYNLSKEHYCRTVLSSDKKIKPQRVNIY